MQKRKIALVGAGNIGGTIAHLAMQQQIADLVLFDINLGLAKGRALDISQAQSVVGSDINIIGTDDYKNLAGADVVVVTAGVARKPGMSRDDLLSINAKVMQSVGAGIAEYCPNAFVICVTNPLDVMVKILQDASKVADNMIVGMAGVLDSSRFRKFLAWEFNVSVEQVQAYVLGGHGDTMVPLIRHTTVAGQSLEQLVASNKITQARLDEIITRTKQGGAEIVSLLKTGSAFYAPAEAVMSMVKAYLFDKNAILPCAAKLQAGQYGIKNSMFVGVLVKIAANGVKEIIELDLTAAEQELFNNSVAAVKNLTLSLANLK